MCCRYACAICCCLGYVTGGYELCNFSERKNAARYTSTHLSRPCVVANWFGSTKRVLLEEAIPKRILVSGSSTSF